MQSSPRRRNTFAGYKTEPLRSIVVGQQLIGNGVTRLRPLRTSRSRTTADEGQSGHGNNGQTDDVSIGWNDELPSSCRRVQFGQIWTNDSEGNVSHEWSQRPVSRLEPLRRSLVDAVQSAGVNGNVMATSRIVPDSKSARVFEGELAFTDDNNEAWKLYRTKEGHGVISGRTESDKGARNRADTFDQLNRTQSVGGKECEKTNFLYCLPADNAGSTSSISKNSAKEESHMKIKLRKLCRFMIVLQRTCRDYKARMSHYLNTYVNTKLVDDLKTELLFDKKMYKHGEQMQVSDEFRRITSKAKQLRTADELKYVTVALGNYQAFATLPANIKHMIAMKGCYETYERRRIIIKEDHLANSVYFILSGEVVVSKMDENTGKSETRCVLTQNDVFGELGVMNGCRRNATVICRDTVELLTFSDQDYIECFMYGGLPSAQRTLLRNLPFLEGWPISVLSENRQFASINYFKKNTVLIHNSRYSDWIVIVKSGSCTVLKKLQNPSTITSPPVGSRLQCRYVPLTCTPINSLSRDRTQTSFRNLPDISPVSRDASLLSFGGRLSPVMASTLTEADIVKLAARRRQRTIYIDQELEDLQLGSQLRTIIQRFSPQLPKSREISSLTAQPAAGESGAFYNDSLNSVTNSAFINTSAVATGQVDSANQRAEYITWPEKLKFSDILNGRYFNERIPITEADRNPTFIRVQVLRKNDVFGLADLVHDDQPALSLVSNGAQCVLIHKRLYVDNAPQSLLARLVKQVQPYPSEEELQSRLQQHNDWSHHRETVLREAIDAVQLHVKQIKSA